MPQQVPEVRARRARRRERGAAATEYALIIAGVAFVVIFGAQVFATLLDARWSSLLTWLGG